MKITEVGTDPLTHETRVTLEHRDSGTVVLVRDDGDWREEQTGRLADEDLIEEVERQLWLRKRDHARKVAEDCARVTRLLNRGTDTGLVSHDNGATWSETTKSMQATVGMLCTGGTGGAGGNGCTSLSGTGEGGAVATMNTGAVLNQRAIEQGGPSPNEVHVTRPLVVALVEAPEAVEVEVRAADGVTGTGDFLVRVKPGELFAYVSSEASTEALKVLAMSIGAELARRAAE